MQSILELFQHFSNEYALLFRTIFDAVAPENTSSLWIGLSDLTTEGEWLWLNGHQASTVDPTLWESGQPNNFNDEQHCAQMYRSTSEARGFLVSDNQCIGGRRTICEKKIQQ